MGLFRLIMYATVPAIFLAVPFAIASPSRPADDAITRLSRGDLQLAQSRRSCKAAKDCRDAVIMWCIDGYAGADRDNDGIPCESLCHSKAEVDKIRAEVGC